MRNQQQQTWQFEYTGRKWIVHPYPIKVRPKWHICPYENTWLCNERDATLMRTKEAKPSPSSNS